MWEPITTAPKDGRPVLLGCALGGPEQGREEVTTESSHTLCVGYFADDVWRTYCCMPDSRPVFMKPTHWLPLPKVSLVAEYP